MNTTIKNWIRLLILSGPDSNCLISLFKRYYACKQANKSKRPVQLFVSRAGVSIYFIYQR